MSASDHPMQTTPFGGFAFAMLAVVAIGLLVLGVTTHCKRDEQSSGSGSESGSTGLPTSARMEFVTHYHQGLELARQFQAGRALAEFQRCLQIRENDRNALFQKARLLLRIGPKEEGLALLRGLAEGDPPMLAARQLLHSLYAMPGPLADARRVLAARDAVRVVCGELGDFDLTLRQWLTTNTAPVSRESLGRRYANLDERSAASPIGRLMYVYARRFDMGPPPTSAAKDRSRNAEADRTCRKLMDDYPGMAGVATEHAMWLLMSQVRFDLVEQTEGPPMNSSITLDLAQKYFEEALDTSALDSSLAHFALLGLGHVARDMGDFDQAAGTYRLLLDQSDVSPAFQYEAHFNLGLVHYRDFNTEKAQSHLRWCASVRQDPLVVWLRSLIKDLQFPFRPEPVSEEHRRTLRFVDRAAELGVDKYDGAGPSAWCDTDLDGDLDLFVCGCDTFCILYRNDGDRFTDVSRQAGLETIASGFSATFADYDNDGDCDLYIGRNGWSGPAGNSLYRNRGDGSFEDVTDQAGVGDPGSSFVHAWADFDRDGYLDLFVANGIGNDGSTNTLYHNNANGTFTDVTESCGLTEAPGTHTIGFAIGDYDRDGWPDIFVNSWRTRHRLYHNRGDGTFEEVATPAGVDGREHPRLGYVAFLEDFDNDTLPDILLTKLARFPLVLQGMASYYRPNPRATRYATKFYRNQGDGTFADESEMAGLLYAHGTMGANVGDVNNDGFLDFYLGTGDPMMARLEPNAFYLNTGHGGFVDLTRFTGLGHLGKGHGITFADYDFDGDLDIYAPQGGFVHGDLWHNAFYHNELGNTNNWLAVQLEGTKSNRMGVGAQLTLRSGDFTIYREMRAGGAFGSSSSPYIHFGLARRTAIDRLEVDWPSGEHVVYADLPVNRYIKIVEASDIITLLEPRRVP